MILPKNDKKIKKDIVAMVVKDLKSKAGQRKPKGDNSDDEGDEDLYNLVRGGKKSSLVIQRLKDEEDFVPTRNLRERVIMMISSDESDSSNYIPKKRKIKKMRNSKRSKMTRKQEVTVSSLTPKIKERRETFSIWPSSLTQMLKGKKELENLTNLWLKKRVKESQSQC